LLNAAFQRSERFSTTRTEAQDYFPISDRMTARRFECNSAGPSSPPTAAARARAGAIFLGWSKVACTGTGGVPRQGCTCGVGFTAILPPSKSSNVSDELSDQNSSPVGKPRDAHSKLSTGQCLVETSHPRATELHCDSATRLSFARSGGGLRALIFPVLLASHNQPYGGVGKDAPVSRSVQRASVISSRCRPGRNSSPLWSDGFRVFGTHSGCASARPRGLAQKPCTASA
jgi:hypothetical protein